MIGSEDVYSAAHLFDPARLTLARELRALTKAELADKVEKSASAISQFEGGRIRPDVQTIHRFALALGVPVSFFARRPGGSIIAVDACHFRSLRSASQRDRRRLLAAGSLLCDLVSVLEQHVDFPMEKVSLAARPASGPIADDEIEAWAVEVRKRWGLGLGPIPNMTRLLEGAGVVVLPVFEQCREVDAFSFWHGRRPCVFLVMEKGCASRTRYDAAHELGHLVLHADVNPANPSAERAANKFGAAFLLPRESFLPECPDRFVYPHFLELKRRWRVSVAGLVKRAYDVGRLSEASYRRAFVFLNQNGLRRHEENEPESEPPQMLPRALELIAGDVPTQAIADEMGLSTGDLLELLGLRSA